MTWSIAHELDFQGDASAPANSLSQYHNGGPYEYHFETFLPAHGWTVSNGERGGGSFSNAGEKTYGIEKTFTYADGRTIDVKYIVELEYSFQDTAYYPWDGTPGAGIGSLDVDFTNGYFPSTSVSKNWKWLVSDEHTDAWFLLGGNQILGWSIPREMYVVAPADTHTCVLLGNQGNSVSWIGRSAAYFGSGFSFDSVVRILNPNFLFASDTNGDTLAFNNQTDMMVKHNITTASLNNISSVNASSIQIGSDYWLDLYPGSVVSLLLKTGAVDLGVL